MAPDTQEEVIKLNVKMISSLFAVFAFVIAGIAWGVRLEYRTESNVLEEGRMQASMETLRHDRQDDHDKLIRQDGQISSILLGIEEIKTMIKERDRK